MLGYAARCRGYHGLQPAELANYFFFRLRATHRLSWSIHQLRSRNPAEMIDESNRRSQFEAVDVLKMPAGSEGNGKVDIVPVDAPARAPSPSGCGPVSDIPETV